MQTRAQSSYSAIANALADDTTTTTAHTTITITIPEQEDTLESTSATSRSSGKRPSRRSHASERAKSTSPYPASSSRGSSEAPLEIVPSARRNAVAFPLPTTPPPVAPTDSWKCPYCAYVQRKRRAPDLRRHIDTHLGDDNFLWVCCGVPEGEAQAEGVPEELLGDKFHFEGQTFVGGCRKTFSRRDALKRHLRARTGSCFGDAYARYLPGNREKDP